VITEQRKTARKVLKTKAAFAVEGQGAVHGRTVDLSANGVSISFTNPLPVGAAGQVIFDLFVDGKATAIHARAKVQYCIFSNGDFKVGFEFVNLELAAMTAVSRYLR
jgi:c-di-GMP-binding flagellar brake protein YcgR